ncbi:YbaK/EbsC family protein [Kitasatospora sp. NPDC058170]|uniref:YbaK/EbsC family protein n=1 Tax=Kitasatospora sp. NPDC058170 TaxID=3346364 RepID=UPI0036DE6013
MPDDTSEQFAAVGVLSRAEPAEPAPTSTYRRLLDLFHQGDIAYRLMDHPPEGQTTLASELRGHKLSAAAKCMVVTVTKGGRPTRHVLAVVPGDRRVDLKQVARAAGGGKARFADQQVAETLGATVSGTITPFSFHPDLQVLADPALFDEPELYFNAARLDRSVAIRAADYRRLARPQVVGIT